jgi:hypothetical protein
MAWSSGGGPAHVGDCSWPAPVIVRGLVPSERIKMPKRGGELGFSKKINCKNLNPTSQTSPLVPTSVPCDSTGKSFAP